MVYPMSVGGIGFDHLPTPSSLACLLFGVRRYLCPSRVMPWYQVFQTPFAEVMLEYRVDIFSTIQTYHFTEEDIGILCRHILLQKTELIMQGSVFCSKQPQKLLA